MSIAKTVLGDLEITLSVQASIWSLWTFILHENCCLAHNRLRVVVGSSNMYQTNSFLPVYAMSVSLSVIVSCKRNSSLTNEPILMEFTTVTVAVYVLRFVHEGR